MITRLFIFLALTASALGQTFNQAVTLTNLLTKAPVVGGLYSVRGYRVDGDWGNARQAMHVPGSTATTNLGNTFTFGTGRLIFTDRTNTVQDLRWWGGTTASSDCTAAFTNAAAYLSGIGGGEIYAPGGTYTFAGEIGDVPTGVGLRGDGRTSTVFDGTAGGSTNYPPFLRWTGSRSSSVYAVSNAPAGGYQLTLSGDLSLAFGDTIAVYNTNDFSGGARSYYRAGQFATVASVDAVTNITLLTPLFDAYSAGVRVYKITHASTTIRDIHFALPVQSAGVTIHYGGPNVRLENVSAAGTEYQHFGFHSCFGSQAVNAKVDWDSESVGLNYGMLFGSSQDCIIDRCDFAAGLAGFDAGNSDTDLDFFVWFPRISNSSFRSIRGLAPGLGLHGNVRGAIIDNCQVNGVNLVGGNTIRNSTIWNGPNYSAINATEMHSGEATIEDNQFFIRTFGLGETEPLARITLQSANPGAGGTVDTNIWAGTWPGTTNQWIRFNRNNIKFLSPVSAGYYGVFIDESSILAANPSAGQKTFGGVEVIGNKFQMSELQPYSSVNFDLIYIAPKTNVLWSDIIVRDNDLPFGGIGIESNGGRIDVSGNRVSRNTQPVAGIRVTRSSYGQFAATSTTIRDNYITDSLRGGILHYRLSGDATIERNIVTDHGRAGTAYAIDVGADAPYTTNLVLLLFRDNLTTINSGSIPGFNIEAPSAEVRFERNREVGVAAGGNRSWATAVVVPWSTTSNGATNVPASIGSLPTASLPSPAGQAITYDSTLAAPLLWDGSEWQRIRRYTETNFVNLRATNTITATDITARSISLPADFPTAPFASQAIPLYLFLSTNTPLAIAIQNNSTDSGAQAKVGFTAGGNISELSQRSPNDSTATIAGKLYIDGGGTGIVFDIDGADSLMGTYGNGTRFWEWSTNMLRLETSVLQADAGITLGGTNRTTWPRDISMPATNGIAVVTGSTNIASRHLVAGTGLSVANGDGQSGNPTVTLANTAVTPGSYTSADITVDQQGRITAAASGVGGGGATGFTLEDPQSNVIHGLTNLTLSVNVGDPLIIGLTGTAASGNLDFQFTKAPLFVNDSPAAWSSPMNFNGTTPVAPSNHENVVFQVSSTNATGYVKARTTTLTSQRAADGEPPASNYATFSTRNSIGVMLYDQTVQESMRFRWCVPSNYSVTNATIVLKWTTTATSGDARWGAQNMVLTGDIDSDSFATAVEATTTTSATSGTVMTTTLSSVGLDGATAGDWVWTEIYRDVGDAADTIAADLELHSIEVRAE